MQDVCSHPLANQSSLLHDLICEATAAHQELQSDSQVMQPFHLPVGWCFCSLAGSWCKGMLMTHSGLCPSSCTATVYMSDSLASSPNCT